MASTPSDTVLAWLAAVNAGDTEAALAQTAADMAIIGPRGTAQGTEVLRDWLNQTRATFETRGVYAASDAVVVASRGVWRDATSGSVRGEADVDTRFRVAQEQVAEIQRYEELATALRHAGLSPTDALPHRPADPAA